MDKNTLTGFLLMGAILFGFMYCNQPAQDSKQQTTSQTTSATNAQSKDDVSYADTLSKTQFDQLAGIVRTLGTLGTDDAYTYSGEGFDLSVNAERHLSGSVAADSSSVEIADLLSAPKAGDVSKHISAVRTAKGIIDRANKYKGFARHIGGENEVVMLENDKMKVSVSTRGGMVSSVMLKEYMTELGEEPTPIQLFQGAKDGYSFIFTTSDQRFDTREFNFTPTLVNDSTLVMSLDLGNNAYWRLRYTLSDNYLLGLEIEQNNVETILPKSTVNIDFSWHQTMARNEKGKTFEQRLSAIYYKYVGESPDDLNAMGDDAEQLSGKLNGLRSKINSSHRLSFRAMRSTT